MAEAYFNVQQARGQAAGAQDIVEKGRLLVRSVSELGKALVAPVETDRARTQLAASEQAAASALEQWRMASADLTRELRLLPTAVVDPQAPPSLQVTLIAPHQPVDSLVPIGLTNRPELASQQALVQATRPDTSGTLRPLIPSIVLGGDAARRARRSLEVLSAPKNAMAIPGQDATTLTCSLWIRSWASATAP